VFLPDISESSVVAQTAFAQLIRVRTATQQRFLVKVARRDSSALPGALLEEEFQFFSESRSPRQLSAVRFARFADSPAAYYEDVEGQPISLDASAAWQRDHFVSLVEELCSILADVHRRGLILTGIAPESFLRGPDPAGLVLTDAALAQRSGIPSRHSPEVWISSNCLAYAAPEVFGGAETSLDVRADLYALGAILYRCLWGREPFETPDPARLIQCHLAKRPEPPTGAVSVPQPVIEAVMRLLEKDPADRFGDLDDFLAALEIRSESKSRPVRDVVVTQVGIDYILQ
jgi:serine/threonine protein kinase